jgi:hypothetical protein
MIPTRYADRLHSKPLRRILFILLIFLAAVSTYQAAHNALNRSQDFQWSGARVLLSHVDPWAEYLRGDPNHRFILTQIPNYLPILYFLVLPTALLPLLYAKIVWLSCNLLFAVVSATVAARFYALRGRALYAVVCLILMATATRNTVGNGQHALLVLFIWSLTLLTPRLTGRRAALSGLSYFKFNFGPALFLYVLLSTIPAILATLFAWLWITAPHTLPSLLHLIAEPLQVSKTGYFPSGTDSNLMDVLESLLVQFGWPLTVVNPVTFAAGLIVCFTVLYCAIHRHSSSSPQWQLALMATMSFCLFKHHEYDSVVLLFPLCYGLRLWRDRRAQVILFIIGFLWYVERLVDILLPSPNRFYIVQFALLLVVLTLTYRLRPYEEQVEPDWASEIPAVAADESSVVPSPGWKGRNKPASQGPQAFRERPELYEQTKDRSGSHKRWA